MGETRLNESPHRMSGEDVLKIKYHFEKSDGDYLMNNCLK